MGGVQGQSCRVKGGETEKRSAEGDQCHCKGDKKIERILLFLPGRWKCCGDLDRVGV